MKPYFASEEAAWAAWRDHEDPRAIEWLVCHYFFIVKGLALRISRRTGKYSNRARIDAGDLMGAGGVALWKALKRFDPAEGVKVNTFIHHRIKGAIWDEVRNLHNHRRVEQPVVMRLMIENPREMTWENRVNDDRRAFSHEPGPQRRLDVDGWWERVLKPLKPIERQTILLMYRYGLSQVETASSLGYASSYICILHDAAIDRLKGFGVSLSDFQLSELAA